MLRMKKFLGALKETRLHLGGVQLIFGFGNGFGASVVMHSGSYGGNKGLWELAVLNKGGLTYDTDITSDVIGRLTFAEVVDYLDKISKLDKEGRLQDPIKS